MTETKLYETARAAFLKLEEFDRNDQSELRRFVKLICGYYDLEKCSQCGSMTNVRRMPLDEGSSDLFCKPSRMELIERSLEAHPDTFVRNPDGTWSCVDYLKKH